LVIVQQRARGTRADQIILTAKAVFTPSNYRSSTTAEFAAEVGVSELLTREDREAQLLVFLERTGWRPSSGTVGRSTSPASS